MTSAYSNRPLFSVIIPTYNRPRELLRAVDSVMRQTLQDYELIIVDDGSETTSCIQDSPNKSDIRSIRVVVNEMNEGVSKARNIGIQHADGHYIAFLDDDDEYLPNFLENTALTFKRSDVDFTWTNALFLDYSEEGIYRRERTFPNEYSSDEDLFQTIIKAGTCYGVAIRSECLRRVGLFDSTLQVGEDTDLFFRLLIAECRPALVPGIGVRIHNHAGSRLTSWHYHEQRLAVCDLFLVRYHNFLSKHPQILRDHVAWMAVIREELRDASKNEMQVRGFS
jgi:glycosyltransferase involved in cell wall biosynthesis